MKLGFMVPNQFLETDSMDRKVQEGLEQVRAAREAGFDLICAGQHYLSAPFQMCTTFPFLARLSAEAGDMWVAATVILVPLHNPVELAEAVATMDAICSGRFIFGVGLGYREEEYAAFGVRRRERVGRLLESLEVMKLLWTQGNVEFTGTYYRVPNTMSTCRPMQKPHPPIWVAANNDKAIVRAARLGYPWLINPHATLSLVEKQTQLYRDNLAGSGGPSLGGLPLLRELYVAEDRETAMRESQPYLARKYQAYSEWGQDKALPGQESFSVPIDQLAKDRFLIGTPDDIVREIHRYQERLGIGWMIFRMQWPGMDHANVMKQMELMARYVIPQVTE